MTRQERADQGFTLVELLVYMVLFGIVGTMVVMLVWNGYRSQLNVTETTYNSGGLQNAALALDHDLKYSAAFSVTEGGAMLRTRSWVGDPTTGNFECRGWFADSTDNTLRRVTGSGSTAGATASSAHDWPVYADGVQAATAFTQAGDHAVQIRLTGIPDAWGRSTVIDTTAVQRPQSSDGSGTCF